MDKRVLIVDDETFVRQSFVDFLEDKRWEMYQAESGEAALEILSKVKVSAAIVDIRLGGMAGDEFIREVILLYPEIVFLICTGSPEYFIPIDLINTDRVSSRLFSKPVLRMSELDLELNRLTGMF